MAACFHTSYLQKTSPENNEHREETRRVRSAARKCGQSIRAFHGARRQAFIMRMMISTPRNKEPLYDIACALTPGNAKHSGAARVAGKKEWPLM